MNKRKINPGRDDQEATENMGPWILSRSHISSYGLKYVVWRSMIVNKAVRSIRADIFQTLKESSKIRYTKFHWVRKLCKCQQRVEDRIHIQNVLQFEQWGYSVQSRKRFVPKAMETTTKGVRMWTTEGRISLLRFLYLKEGGLMVRQAHSNPNRYYNSMTWGRRREQWRIHVNLSWRTL